MMLKQWILSRWRGNAPLGTVFWHDMMFVGTLINAATTLGAVGLLALEAPTALAIFIFLLPLPWNLLLFFSVWRSAVRTGGFTATAAQMAATIWLIAATTL
ncbi:MAG: hypothetical protein KL840_04380 [Aquamicrobium sp.]|nr:hypothetical protein [Aquamicrobium sp.]